MSNSRYQFTDRLCEGVNCTNYLRKYQAKYCGHQCSNSRRERHEGKQGWQVEENKVMAEIRACRELITKPWKPKEVESQFIRPWMQAPNV